MLKCLTGIIRKYTSQQAKHSIKYAQYIASLMQKHGIVPDVLETAPSKLVDVLYKKSLRAELGNKLTPSQVLQEPVVSWTADDSERFVLCLVSPDVPSRNNPKFKEFQHWLVVNIAGCDISKGQVIAPYMGAIPAPNTGYHRYIFLVYKQPEEIEFEERMIRGDSKKHRTGFNVMQFAKKYNLGVPYAGNFFISEWDKTVTTQVLRFEH